jgi:hypothetical protein
MDFPPESFQVKSSPASFEFSPQWSQSGSFDPAGAQEKSVRSFDKFKVFARLHPQGIQHPGRKGNLPFGGNLD